jgi:hypothetical protein
MNAKPAAVVAVGLMVGLALSSPGGRAQGQPKVQEQRWAYLVVSVPLDNKQATNLFSKLAV